MLDFVTMGWGMKRWLAIAVKNWLAGGLASILTLGVLSGCQPTFLEKQVFEGAHAPLPPKLEESHCPITEPITALVKAPPTVSLPDRLPRYLTLQEALAIALESGTVTGRGISNLGLIPAPGGGAPSTTGLGFSASSQNDSIRILAFLPAINNAAIEQSVSRFDPVFSTYMIYTNIDSVIGVPNNLGALPDSSIFGSPTSEGGVGTRWGSSLTKAFAGGGVANIGFLVDYRNLNNNGVAPVPASGLLNPQYTARMNISFEQPLWRDFGTFINQILPTFPSITGQGLPSAHEGNAFNQHQGKVGGDGILIARLKFDQSRAHFENNVNTLAANVEIAYWNLYNKYGQLYSFEENLRIMHKAWQENYDRFKVGGKDPPEYYQVRGQYEEFRGERFRALNEVLEAERNLRSILGIPVEDGSRLVPITPPTMAEQKPSWENCLHDALNSRPDIAWARQELQKSQFALTVQKNNLRPDLRFIARIDPYGDGSTLTGNGTYLDTAGTLQPSNAFQSLKKGNLADWQLGLTLNMPLGFRAEYAAIRAARMVLTTNYLLLKDWENQVTFQVAREYAELDHWYERIKAHRAERMGYGDSVKKKIDKVEAGSGIIGDFQFLESQRRYAAALVKEYAAIAEYNSTLARLEWAKGTILRYNNVHISDGALPEAVQVRAVEYEKERSKSLVLRERPDSLYHPGRLCGTTETAPTNLSETPAQEPLGAPKRIVPLQPESKSNIVLPPIMTRQVDEKSLPSKAEQVEFRPAGTPKQPSSPLPAPLPQLETKPLPSVLPPSTSAIPTTAPWSASMQQTSSIQIPSNPTGFVTMEDSVTRFARASQEASTANPPQTPAPTVVRAAIGGPQLVESPFSVLK
jgi:outer membrane protein TolC